MSQRLSVYKANEIALRDCGAKRSRICVAAKGGVQKADEASRSPGPWVT